MLNSFGYERKRFVPASAIRSFNSASSNPAENVLISCVFCPETTSANLLALCDEEGYVSVVDVLSLVESNRLASSKRWRAHENACMAARWVPGRSDQLLTVSGDETASLWDVRTAKRLNVFRSHQTTVRCASFDPLNPHCFATGARDGAIVVWDCRTKSRNSKGDLVPVDKIHSAHHFPLSEERNINSHKRRSLKKRDTCVGSSLLSVTSLLHYDSNTIVSASSSVKSGIRFWDLRKSYNHRMKQAVPCRTLLFPEKRKRRNAGVASICFDRFTNCLFAAATDSVVYEFVLPTCTNLPCNEYEGASIDSFYVHLDYCPLADFLISGSAKASAVIWDLQGRCKQSRKNLPFPSFVLHGHDKEVTGVSWSQNFQCLATCDDSSWRLWSLNSCDSVESSSSQRQVVSDFRAPHTATNRNDFQCLIISPAKSQLRSPLKPVPNRSMSHNEMTETGSIMKRRLPFQSRFKTDRLDILKENRSPIKKISKSEDVLQKRPMPFHYKYPTMHLPNFLTTEAIHERKQSTVLVVTAKRTPKIRDLKDWLVKEPRKRMVSSPQVIKVSFKKQSENRPVSPTKLETNRARAESRTILDFFQKD